MATTTTGETNLTNVLFLCVENVCQSIKSCHNASVLTADAVSLPPYGLSHVKQWVRSSFAKTKVLD